VSSRRTSLRPDKCGCVGRPSEQRADVALHQCELAPPARSPVSTWGVLHGLGRVGLVASVGVSQRGALDEITDDRPSLLTEQRGCGPAISASAGNSGRRRPRRHRRAPSGLVVRSRSDMQQVGLLQAARKAAMVRGRSAATDPDPRDSGKTFEDIPPLPVFEAASEPVCPRVRLGPTSLVRGHRSGR
jgi:hypothetical protein